MELVRINFKVINSTNSWAKEHFDSFERGQLIIITANEQTHARGQYGKRWQAPADLNLYVTYCFFANHQSKPLSFTHLLALSTLNFLNKHFISAQIKWPNDLLVNEKKIAGILCETIPYEKDIGIVLGMGLNINLTEEWQKKIDQPATSIYLETGKKLAIEKVLSELTESFKKDLEICLKEGFTPFEPLLETHLIYK